MISPEPVDVELKWYNENHQKVVKAIRDVYSKTGLYRNDGSKEPLWTVDWYAYHVKVASDGIHLVRFGRTPVLEGRFGDKNRTITKRDLKQEAISIFAKGKMVRTYSIGKLVDDPKKLQMTVSHFLWLDDAQVADDKNQLEIVTLDRNRIIIDLASGNIVEKTKARRCCRHQSSVQYCTRSPASDNWKNHPALAEPDGRSHRGDKMVAADTPQPLPENIVTAWKEVGAEAHWLRACPAGFPQYIPEKEGKPGDLPAFRFVVWHEGLLAKLPAPVTAFGLALYNSQVTDAGLKELAGLKSLQTLDLTKVTERG